MPVHYENSFMCHTINVSLDLNPLPLLYCTKYHNLRNVYKIPE